MDEITFACPECKDGTMYRVPELIDVWFDSGSMPVAQWHYPFENQEKFGEQFPADFICEAVDQTRGWFYALHAISTLLFDSVAYKNVVCLGPMLDAEGRQMSKRWATSSTPRTCWMRTAPMPFAGISTPPRLPARRSASRPTWWARWCAPSCSPLWNIYSFFVTYATSTGGSRMTNRARAPDRRADQRAYTALDRWILSELHSLVRQITQPMETYDVLGATRPIETFVDRLSNWYLRRTRRRFWRRGARARRRTPTSTPPTPRSTRA